MGDCRLKSKRWPSVALSSAAVWMSCSLIIQIPCCIKCNGMWCAVQLNVYKVWFFVPCESCKYVDSNVKAKLKLENTWVIVASLEMRFRVVCFLRSFFLLSLTFSLYSSLFKNFTFNNVDTFFLGRVCMYVRVRVSATNPHWSNDSSTFSTAHWTTKVFGTAQKKLKRFTHPVFCN